MDRKYVIFAPFQGSNAYIENMKRCWGKLYEVISPLSAENNFFILLNTRAIVLNWIEYDLNFERKMQLMWYKILGIKIIWVFHNRIPHDSGKAMESVEKQKSNMKFIASISDVVILHSKSSRKYLFEYTKRYKLPFYIPHINYMRQNEWTEESHRNNDEKFRFVFQGVIAPYKNIEILIKVFKELNLPNCELYIVGKPSSIEYASALKRLCDCKEIKMRLAYLSDYEVGQEIQKGDVVVLPYDLKSSMNSGAMIAAFSNKRTVIISANAMAQDLEKKDFLYVYDYLNQDEHHHQLKTMMELAYRNGVVVNREKGEKAFEYVRKYNGEEIVVKSLQKMIKQKL